jgi:DNA replication protein DnaC
MNNHSTIEKMKQMRMTGMAEAYHNNLQSSNYQNYTVDQYIAMLIDQEWEYRQDRKFNGLIKKARFKLQPSVRDIDYSHPRNLDRNLFERLVSLDFIKKNENIIITGPTGCGKSYLAQALGMHACQMMFKTLYFNPNCSLENHVGTKNGQLINSAELHKPLNHSRLFMANESFNIRELPSFTI